MKFANLFFGGLTAFALLSFFRTSFSPAPYPDAFDSRVKLTSLITSSEVIDHPPVFISVAGAENSATPAIPDIATRAALVVRLKDGKIFLNFNSSGRHPLASLTKLMTAVVAAEKMGAARGVTISKEDVLEEGDLGGFAAGEIFAGGDLITSMMTVSSNDAAHALARTYGTNDFINAMQEKANELGMANTSFADATGLTSLNQSSAEDIAVLIRYVSERHPDFFRVSSQKETVIKEISSGKEKQLKNINKFAGRADFRGGKTGYTTEAGGNLISLFNIGGSDIGIIVLGSAETESRFTESEKLYDWVKNMIR